MRWELIAVGYCTYLALAALARPQFRRARWPAAAVCAVAWGAVAAFSSTEAGTLINVVVPMPVLLGGYWLSGLFFVKPMVGVERWLLGVDERLLGGALAAYQAGPRVVRDYFEIAYTLVYLVVPAGAVTLALGGHADRVPRFWAVVLLAEFLSYGMLPWLQTRPPRALAVADQAAEPAGVFRRLNLLVLSRGSIQVNTLPSGHAAGATAVALTLMADMPTAGLVFVVLGTSVVCATVVGRYHYLVDSVLGVLAAVAAWLLLSRG